MFTELKLNDRLIKALDHLDITEPSEVQKQAIPAAIAGRDLIVSAETGSGKTAAFLLPTLNKLLESNPRNTGTRALILTPTRELCRQVVKHCKQLTQFTGLEVNSITGGFDFKYQRAIFRKNPEILVATPGRLKEHIERGSPDFSDLEVLILDEADRMLDMGFMEDVMEIVDNCNPVRQTLLFSATINKHQIDVDSLMDDPEVITLSTPRQSNDSITQKMVLTDNDKHKDKVLLKLLNEQEFDKCVIFANTKTQTNRLAGWLRYMKLNIGVLHGDMDQDARNNEMNRLRRGRVKILVATDVASRGIDVSGVGMVINYDLARNSEDFIHRTGRTGRAGEEGLAISFIGHRDWDLKVTIERQLDITLDQIKVPGLDAKFKGPKKLKASGKRAGDKKRGDSKNKPTEKKKEPKVRHRDIKNIGKRRKPSSERPKSERTEAKTEKKSGQWGDGFTPMLKKKVNKNID